MKNSVLFFCSFSLFAALVAGNAGNISAQTISPRVPA